MAEHPPTHIQLPAPTPPPQAASRIHLLRTKDVVLRMAGRQAMVAQRLTARTLIHLGRLRRLEDLQIHLLETGMRIRAVILEEYGRIKEVIRMGIARNGVGYRKPHTAFALEWKTGKGLERTQSSTFFNLPVHSAWHSTLSSQHPLSCRPYLSSPCTA